MRNRFTFNKLVFVCGLILSAPAAAQSLATQWERETALAAVESVNIETAVFEIGDISSLSDGKTTLGNLENLQTRGDWPIPAREAAIYQFTRSLAELPRQAVAGEVIRYLQEYQALTLVPHEDHRDALVPLFNIRAAAAGVENSWQKVEFAIEAETLLEAEPLTLLEAYANSTNQSQRSAYLAALQYADLTDVTAIQNVALQQLEQKPELTPVIGVTVLSNTDIFAVEQLLIHGSGAGLASVLTQLGDRLQYSDTAGLLAFAIHDAPAVNATLAIAAWWPRLKHDAETRDLLIDTLAQPELGASAALALAQSPDIQTIKILQDTAGGDTSAARRAQMALDINRDRLIREDEL